MKKILFISACLIFSIWADAQSAIQVAKHPIRDWVFSLSIYLVCIAVPFYAAIVIFKIISENKFRNKLLDKNISDESIKLLITNGNRRLQLEVIMWALLFSFIGLAIFLTQLFKFGRLSSIGFIFISVALSLFVFYSIMRRQGSK